MENKLSRFYSNLKEDNQERFNKTYSSSDPLKRLNYPNKTT